MLSYISPLTYFTDLARYSFTDSHFFPIGADCAALVVFTLVFTAVTMDLHKRTMPERM